MVPTLTQKMPNFVLTLQISALVLLVVAEIGFFNIKLTRPIKRSSITVSIAIWV